VLAPPIFYGTHNFVYKIKNHFIKETQNWIYKELSKVQHPVCTGGPAFNIYAKRALNKTKKRPSITLSFGLSI
jgi:hypothetical protein